MLKPIPSLSSHLSMNAILVNFSNILFICAELRAIGVYSGTFVQKVLRDLYRADDDNMLSQDAGV